MLIGKGRKPKASELITVLQLQESRVEATGPEMPTGQWQGRERYTWHLGGSAGRTW